eukprot:gb/GFBE01011807.1/.p1 GENE.gb/GFBE01011807.1/~~gb/GFBE01011807.1/.p1  ORF type:complete len:216 (+),score=32.36 gb/GFBE01011807.1/:1-648(+)
MSTCSRTRTEWLMGGLAKNAGEIRNIFVLGIISGRLVVSFQGSGRVRVFVNNEHSLELEETGRSDNTRKLSDDEDGRGGCVDWTKKYSKYVVNSRNLRYAEFALPSLPARVLVVGETFPSDDKQIPTTKPVTEARSLAKVAVSGHVTNQQRFHANLGAPGHPVGHSRSGEPGNISIAAGTMSLPKRNSEITLPRSVAGSHYQTLSASQKIFHPVD